MEDSFRVRVDKVFGSLNTASSSSFSSLWSLSDEEIERKEWKRYSPSDPNPDNEDPPPSSYLDGFVAPHIHTPPLPPPPPTTTTTLPPPPDFSSKQQLYSDLQEIDDHHQEQDLDIRSSIGLDSTLDFEEEEDEYDKVAIGREEAGDLLYMIDVVDYGIGVNAHNELPSSFAEATRDPRANHMAAKLRLREDAEAAGNFDTLKLSEIYDPSVSNARSKNILEDTVIPKPILKKREKPTDEKLPKRVRFHEQSVGAKDSTMHSRSVEETPPLDGALNLPEANAADEEASLPQKSSSDEESSLLDDVSSLPQVTPSVPDYLRNPARYTRYNLDSSNDTDEECNRKAYMEFLNHLKKANSAGVKLDDTSVTAQHPLTFTPKKQQQQQDSSLVKENESKQPRGEISKDKPFPVGVAAGDTHAQDTEVCAMDEDVVETAVGKISKKSGRQYRTKRRDDEDSDGNETGL